MKVDQRYNVVLTVTHLGTGRTTQRDLTNVANPLYAIKVVAESMRDEFKDKEHE